MASHVGTDVANEKNEFRDDEKITGIQDISPLSMRTNAGRNSVTISEKPLTASASPAPPDTGELVESPRSSGSTSASPCSFGPSIGTTDPLVDSPETDDPRPTLTGKSLGVLIVGLLTSSFILALDQMIIATALPIISSTYNSLAQLPWVVNGFFLTQATGTLTFGQLYTFLPAKQTLLCSILLFEIGSILSAAAPSFPVLIIGRAVSGLGAGGLVVGSHTIVGQVVRLTERSVYYSSLGVVFTAASVGGPLMGGLITDKLGWRWCFWINLPFGAIGAAVIYFALPAYAVRLPRKLCGKRTWRRWASIDWVGNAFALGMTMSLILALQWGGSVFAWDDKVIIALFALVAVLLGLFLYWEIRTAREGLAMVPISLLRNRTVSGASISGFSVHILFGVAAAYLPLLYQSRGSSALQSGIDILPFMVSSVGFVIIAGVAVKRIGYYKAWIVAGPWIAAVGSGLLTDSRLLSREYLIGWQIIVGAGFGMAFQNTVMAVQAEYAPDHLNHLIPQATSIVGFFQRTGPMIGVSIAGSIFANNLDHQISTLPFSLTDGQISQIRHSVQYIWSETAKSEGLTDSQRTVIVGVFVDSVRHALYVLPPAAVLSGAAALLVKNWNIRKRGKP